MRQHGTEAKTKRDAARTAELFLAAMQQAACELRAELEIPAYKPVRGFAPAPKEA